MQSKVFSIFDSCAKAFLPPFCLLRSEIAERAFSDCINSKTHQFSEHPEDYHLFQIGSFDDATGLFTNEAPAHIKLGNGLLYKKPDNVVDLFTPDQEKTA